MTAKPLTYGALALLILIWGTTWGAIRIGLAGLPPFTGVAIRFTMAGVVLLAVARLAGWPWGRGRRVYGLWAINAVFTFAVPYGVVYWAEQWVPSGLAAVLFSTFPLFVALMAHAWLPGERLRPASLVGVLTGFLGVVVIFSDDLTALAGAETRWAATIFLLSPLVSAFGNILIKRWAGGVHPLSLTAVPMVLTGAVMGVVAALVERGEGIALDTPSTLALFYLALCGTSLTFVVYFWLLDRLPATRLSLITYGVPVVAVTTGTLFLDEPFTLHMLIGTILVLGGVLVAVRIGRADG